MKTRRQKEKRKFEREFDRAPREIIEVLPNFPIQLPEEIWMEVFEQLSSVTMFNAMMAFNDWLEVFVYSPHLLNKFQLCIDEDFVNYFVSHLPKLPRVPTKRLKISYNFLVADHIQPILSILKIYKNSIEDLELEMRIDSSETLKELLTFFVNLTTVSIKFSFRSTKSDIQPLNFLKLKSLMITSGYSGQISHVLRFFKYNKTVENLAVTFINFCPCCFRDSCMERFVNREFDDFLLSLPNLKSLTAPQTYIDEYDTLVKLQDFSSNSFGNNRQQQMKFLEFHKESLKNLRFNRLPTGVNGDELFRYIFEEMNLENLYWRTTPLIVNRKLQLSSNCLLEIQDDNIPANLIFAEFIPIEKVKVHFLEYGSCEIDIAPLNRPTKVFFTVHDLSIKIRSGRYFSALHGFLQNCKNVKKFKLTLFSYEFRTDLDIIRSYLLTLTQLQEFSFSACFLSSTRARILNNFNDVDLTDIDFRNRALFFEVVREACGNLKILNIPEDYLVEAKEYFGDKLVVKGFKCA